MSGKAPQKFMVLVPPYTGLADKLVGVPSVFLWALLTHRAFQTVPNHNFPSWSELFAFPHINITGVTINNSKIINAPSDVDYNDYIIRNTGKSVGLNNIQMDFNEYFPVCLRNNDSANDAILLKSDLKHYPPTYFNARTIIVETNRGVSYRMFDNPFHRNKLLGMGLTAETAFGCVMRYLFSIRPDGCDAICRRIMQSMADANRNDIAVIGIQVRVGDQVMSGKDVASHDTAAPHMRCAQGIADHLMSTQGVKSIFYLMSDSFAVLHAVKAKYGDLVLADNETRPVHTAHCSGSPDCSTTAGRLRLIHHSTNQVFLYSRANYHVVSRSSGFGMMGAWMNARPVKGRVFRIDGPNAQCIPGHFRDVERDPRLLSMDWSGI
jgi:hypothetical protein